MPFSILSRGWKIVVVVSLAVNLLVLGLIVGAGVMHNAGPSDRAMRGASAFIAALPEPERRAVIRDLRPGKGGLEARHGRAARFEAVLETLQQDPFDAARLEMLLQDQRGAERARIGRAEAALLARLTTMTPQARRDYAERLEQLVRKRR